MPTYKQNILFREKDNENWTSAKVIGVFKKSSKYRNFRQLQLDDGSKVEKDVATTITEWIDKKSEHETVTEKEEDTFILEDIVESNTSTAFPVRNVPLKEHDTEEVKEAKLSEIKKFKEFGAVVEVDDEGQHRVPVHWVITQQDGDE